MKEATINNKGGRGKKRDAQGTGVARKREKKKKI